MNSIDQREQSKPTESGSVVRFQQFAYYAGTIGWLIIVAGLYLISGNKPGLGPTVITLCLGPLLMGFIVAVWNWTIRRGFRNSFCRSTLLVSLALSITLPVVTFMDDIAGASSGLILTVLISAVGAGILVARATNKSKES